MNARVLAISTLLLSYVGPPCAAEAWAQDPVAEPPDLAPEQREVIAGQTCRAWYGREIATVESDSRNGEDPVWWWVTCLPHDSYDIAAIAGLGKCRKDGLGWFCHEAGTQLVYQSGTERQTLQAIDVSPRIAFGIVEFLRAEERNAKEKVFENFPSYFMVSKWVKRDAYHVEYYWRDEQGDGWASGYELRGRCGKTRCHFRHTDYWAYPTYD